MDKLIQNGTLVLPQGQMKGDLLIRAEQIAEIGREIHADLRRTEIIDADGCLVFPGFVDAHTHFQHDDGRYISPEDFATGGRAALLGGTTTILNYAAQRRGETLAQGLAYWRAAAQGASSCDYGFHMTITEWNQTVSREIEKIADEGVTSFEADMARDNPRLSDRDLYAILRRMGELGAVLCCHCENGGIVQALTDALKSKGKTGPGYYPAAHPEEAETEAVHRLLTIAKLADEPVNILHLSSAKSLRFVEEARIRGQEVYAETCPQYLLLDESRYGLPAPLSAIHVLSPPLRGPDDQEALWLAVSSGAIDTIGSDHRGYNLAAQKDQNLLDFSAIPNGIPGVGHRQVLLYTYGVAAGRLTPEDMARLLAENPAKLFGLYPRKGVLAAGSDADVVLWDPWRKGFITAGDKLHHVDNTPYEGLPVMGGVRQVYLRGQLVVRGNEVMEKGKGQYLVRTPGIRFRKTFAEVGGAK